MPNEAVLVVDDNAQNLKLTRLLLLDEGYDVYTASSAEDAVRMLRDVAPRVILMDVQLPGLDGLELTRRLKAAPETRHIAIVALTAYAMKGDRDKALAAGCDDYVSKPVDLDALAHVVRRLVTTTDPGR